MSSDRHGASPPGMRPAPQPLRQHENGSSAVAASPEQVMRTCPICRRELAERKCKLYCPDPRCGYFLSCADYY